MRGLGVYESPVKNACSLRLLEVCVYGKSRTGIGKKQERPLVTSFRLRAGCPILDARSCAVGWGIAKRPLSLTPASTSQAHPPDTHTTESYSTSTTQAQQQIHPAQGSYGYRPSSPAASPQSEH